MEHVPDSRIVREKLRIMNDSAVVERKQKAREDSLDAREADLDAREDSVKAREDEQERHRLEQEAKRKKQDAQRAFMDQYQEPEPLKQNSTAGIDFAQRIRGVTNALQIT